MVLVLIVSYAHAFFISEGEAALAHAQAADWRFHRSFCARSLWWCTDCRTEARDSPPGRLPERLNDDAHRARRAVTGGRDRAGGLNEAEARFANYLDDHG